MDKHIAVGKTILVADDEKSVRWATRLLLDLDEHEVTEAADGGKALDLFAKDRFDLVITDFQMPHMTGNELAEKIKTLAPNQPILLMTAYGENLESKNMPVDGTLTKPFTIEQLRAAIAKLLSRERPGVLLCQTPAAA